MLCASPSTPSHLHTTTSPHLHVSTHPRMYLISHPLARVANGAAAPSESRTPWLGHEVRERRSQVVYRLDPGVLEGLGRG